MKRGRKRLRLFPGKGYLGEARESGGSCEQVSEGDGSQCREGEEPPPGRLGQNSVYEFEIVTELKRRRKDYLMG